MKEIKMQHYNRLLIILVEKVIIVEDRNKNVNLISKGFLMSPLKESPTLSFF